MKHTPKANGNTTPARRWIAALFGLVLALAPTAAFGAFGYTDNGTAYVVDTGAGLVFQVRKTDGTITSIVYNGVEYNGPSGKGSHLSSGLGSATVTPQTDGATYVMLTLQTGTTGTADPNMTQYLVVRNGENTIYMATFPGQEPDVGELRWITRLDHSLLPNGPVPSNLDGNTGAIESSDVFGMPDGTTRSKYYGDHVTHGKERAMDLTYDGATGTNVGVWMIFGNRESSSGGPFFRDIQNQAGGDQEIYNYMNSGHNQTEAYRLNVLHGPYALVFNNGAAPTYPIDFSWMGSLGLTGWVGASGRGAVAGTSSGIPAGFQGVMAFANDTAQYWAVVNPADGSYTCSEMKPGTYAVTLYKGELSVATSTVTVAAGSTTPLNMASAEPAPGVIFRIGDWDGSPAGFLNADNIVQMHPSDVRNAAWGPVTYTVGTDSASAWPAIQTRQANDGNTIKFTLAANQITTLTMRIGITCSYPKGGGRPFIEVNGTASPTPAASTQPDSRSFTIGTYRGNNVLYTYSIPASQLVVGTNTIKIFAASGSPDSGTWLAAGWVYDSVELDGPVATPVITYVGGSPLVISGTSEPGRTITLTLDGSTPAGTAVTSANRAWSITYGGSLTPGAHSFTAVASDNAGHSSPTSSAYAFNTSVTMPVITAAVGDTGTYASGATTSDRVFVFSGTAGAGDSVTVVRVGTGVVGTVAADGSGQWSFDYTGVSLPDGLNSFYATGSNVNGSSPSSPIFTLNLAGQPRISIVRYNPAFQTIPDSLASVVFRVTFNQTVNGVTPGAFSVVTSGTAAGTVASVSAATGTVFDVTVNTLAGAGSLKIVLNPANGITDTGGNPEAGYTASQSYLLVTPSTGDGAWINPISGGAWSEPINWSGAVVADGATHTANFSTLDLTATNTVHVDTARTINSMVFGDTDTSTAAGWVLDNGGNPANVLTLAGTTPTITVNALGTGADTTISAPVAGSSGLTKVGAGTLVLAGPDTLSGTVNVNAGTLQIAPSGALNLGSSAINTNTNSQLAVEGGSLATTGLVTAVSSPVILDSGTANLGSFRTNSTFSGTLRVNGGTLAIGDVNIRRNAGSSPDFTSGFIVTGGNATSTTIELGSDNSYGCMSLEGTGNLVATGVVTLGNQVTSGRGGALRVIGNATFTSTESLLGIVMSKKSGSNANNVATATFSGGVSTVEKFTMGYDATVNAGSATITVNGGALYLGSGGIVKNGVSPFATTLSFSSGIVGAKANWATALNVNLPSGGNVAFNAADAGGNPFAITLNGVVGGAGGFTKIGAGTLTLDGAVTHTYTGVTNVNRGALRITSALGNAPNPVNVNATGVLTGNGTINRPVVLNNGGAIAPDGAAPTATLTGTSLTWNGGGTLAMDLGAAPVADQVALSGAMAKGTAGTYTLALNPTAPFAAGDLFTLASFASTTFVPPDFQVTGLPAGFGGRVILTPTNLRVLIVARPVITSPGTASGTYGTVLSYQITAQNGPTSFGALNLPPGVNVDSTTGLISGTPTAAGTYNVTISATNEGGTDTELVVMTIAKAVAQVSVGVPGNSTIRRTYDGTAQSATITTVPPGLNATFTYNGSATAPTLPGTYDVAATIDDPNYMGTATGKLVITITGLVRHAPTVNGELDGSFQMLTGENLSLGGNAVISGDLLVPGTPAVQFNGQPTLADVHDASGNTAPDDYTATFSGSAMARYLVRRVDPIAMPVVVAPAAPAGTRNVVINRSTDPIGDPATLNALALKGSAGFVALPPGTYGNLTANGGTGFILGVAGATEPAVYDVQQLTLNGNATIQIVGPVILRLGGNLAFNGTIGNATDPRLLTIELVTGGVALNGSAQLYGLVVAPQGAVTLNGSSAITGEVTADKLVINGTSALIEAP